MLSGVFSLVVVFRNYRSKSIYGKYRQLTECIGQCFYAAGKYVDLSTFCLLPYRPLNPIHTQKVMQSQVYKTFLVRSIVQGQPYTCNE